MTISSQLKSFLVSKGWLAENATDDQAKQAVSTRILSGELSPKDLVELTKAPDSKPDAKTVVGEMIDEKLGAALTPLAASLKALTEKLGNQVPAVLDVKNSELAPLSSQYTPEAIAALIEKRVGETVTARLGQGGEVAGGGMSGILSRSAEILGRPEARVKGAIEQYAHVKTAAIYPSHCGIGGTGTPHPYAGKQAQCAGIILDHPSDRDKAVSAAWFKFALSKANSPHEIPYRLQMNEHDKDLLRWTVKNATFSGFLRSNPANEYDAETGDQIKVERRRLTEYEQKALLDDSVSGGIEIAPIEFDDALVTTPVLYGELFPLVSVQNVTRGRRIKGGAVSNPTFTWGMAEGTAIQPFNTSQFVSAFDTTIFVASAAMEIGLDFEEDSPTNIGQIILTKYGEKFLETLDYVVAVGDGLTQPQGIFTTAGLNTIVSDMGSDGPATVSDYEGLMFGISKAFRGAKGARNIFLGSDTSYMRCRTIPLAPGDERRVFGMDNMSYNVLGHPYKVQNSIPNSSIGFCNMGFYRMYRRLGLNVKITGEGARLTSENKKLIVVRARYGGRLELSGAACAILDGMN